MKKFVPYREDEAGYIKVCMLVLRGIAKDISAELEKAQWGDQNGIARARHMLGQAVRFVPVGSEKALYDWFERECEIRCLTEES